MVIWIKPQHLIPPGMVGFEAPGLRHVCFRCSSTLSYTSRDVKTTLADPGEFILCPVCGVYNNLHPEQGVN